MSPAPTPPETPFSLQIIRALWLSRAVWAAAKLKLADTIADGADTLEALAARSGTDPAFLGRLMAALAGGGVFTIGADGRYGLTETGETLRSDHPASQRAMLEAVLGGEHYEAWGALEDVLKRGRNGMDLRFGTTWVGWFRDHPDRGRVFAEAMSDFTRVVEEAVMGAWEVPPFELAVDLGGSHGSLIRKVLERRPDGRGLVFDLPEVVAQWEPSETTERLQAMAGDFFEKAPAADLYLMKFILHDWTDDQSLQILKTVRKAAKTGARVAVVENLLPAAGEPHPGWLMDLNMMVMTGGRERTAEEYGALFDQAGFRVERVIRTEGPMGVVQAIAV